MPWLKDLVPIVKWLPLYTLHKLLNDFIAGMAVGLTVIPQGLAYASIARLPAAFGLYSAFMGPFIYCIFGTSKDISLGPTAIMSALVAAACARPPSWPKELNVPPDVTSDPNIAVTLSFFTGIILISVGLCRLGFMVNFISHPVITGFICSAAITIPAGQLKKIFGIHIATHKFFPEMWELVKGLKDTNIYDFIVGISTMILLFLMKYIKSRYADKEGLHKGVRQTCWFIGTARNAVVVIFFAVISFIVNHNLISYWDDGCPNSKPGKPYCTVFTLTKIKKNSTVPAFALPTWDYSYICDPTDPSELCSHDGHFHVTISRILSGLGSSLAIIPLMGYLESISIAKGFAIKNDYKVSNSQELVAIGASNFFGSFVSSYPVTGSFSRSSVNDQSNVATPAGGVMVGVLVLLALAFLTSAFEYIPAATLGAVIIMAASQMFDLQGIIQIWRISKLDAIPLGVTFIGCLFDTADGIIIGIAVHLVILLYRYAIPTLVDKEEGGVLSISIESDLFFPAAEKLADQLLLYQELYESKNVVLDLTKVTEIDSAAAQALKTTIQSSMKKGVDYKIVATNQHILDRLQSAGIFQVLNKGLADGDNHANGTYGTFDNHSSIHDSTEDLIEDTTTEAP